MHRRPVAYIILCHSSAESVEDLLQSIYNEIDVFIIHLDAKADRRTKEDIFSLVLNNQNLMLMPSAVCSWGGFSLVNAAVCGIARLLSHPVNWSHVILLSEQHYPLYDASTIANRLEENVSYFTAHSYNSYYTEGKLDIEHRFSKYFREIEGVGIFAAGDRREDISHVYHGSQWVVLSRRAAEFVQSTFGSQQTSQFFSQSLIPDETAFPTALVNASQEDRGTIELVETTFVAWPHRTDNPHQIASKETFEAALASSALFIRKRPSNMDGLEQFIIKGASTFRSHAADTPRGIENLRAVLKKAIHSRKCRTLEATEKYNASVASVFIKSKLAEFELLDYKNSFPNCTIYFSLRKAHWMHGLRVCILSHNLTNYAVVVVAESKDGSYSHRSIGPFKTHKLKVRMWDLFMHDQIEVPIRDFGLVDAANVARPQEVVDRIYEASVQAENISGAEVG